MKRTLLLPSLLVFGLTWFGRISYANSDPRLTLLVSQSLLEHRVAYLDAYRGRLLVGASFDELLAAGAIQERGGHYYNYFPLGPSLLSLPAVALAQAAGADMSQAGANFALQNWLSAASSVVALWIVYALGRCYLAPSASLAIAAVSVLGSGLVSTLGTAFWSSNLAVIFLGLSLLLLARQNAGLSATTKPALLGGLMFLAYLSKPVAAAFILPALGYLWWLRRREFWPAGLAAAGLFGLFSLWNWSEFGRWLPDYASLARFSAERAPLPEALYGQLFSASRGLFVFSPFLLLLIPGAALLARPSARRPMGRLCLAWFGLQLLLASLAASWWGGHSFGPRVMVEAGLPLALLTILAWREAQGRLRPGKRGALAAAYLGLGALAVGIHSLQGLYNPASGVHNQVVEDRTQPPFSGLSDYFDWRYPQFLATPELLCAKLEAHMAALLPYEHTLGVYPWGGPIRFNADQTQNVRASALRAAEAAASGSQQPVADLGASAAQAAAPAGPERTFLPVIQRGANLALFVGWRKPVVGEPFRRSYCAEAGLLLQVGEVRAAEYDLFLELGSQQPQRVSVLVNGQPVGRWKVEPPMERPQMAQFRFAGSLIAPNGLNEIAFQVDKPFWQHVILDDADLALYQAAIYPAGERPFRPLPVTRPPAYP